LASALILGLAACSGDSDDGQNQTGDGQVEITFATWWAYADDALIQKFTDQHPDIKVNLQFTAIDGYPSKIQAEASAGTLPDVFSAQGSYLVEMAKGGQLLDLQEALKTAPYDGSAATWREAFNPVLITSTNVPMEAYEENGEVFALPFGALSVAGLYNKDIFKEVGIEPPTSFADLLSNCQAIKAAGYIPMSLTGSVWLDWWFNLAWDQTMRGKDKANFSASDPAYIKGIENVQLLAEAGCWDPSQITTDIDAETSLFLQGKTAQFITVPENFLLTIIDGVKFDLGSYVLPGISPDAKAPVHTLGGGTNTVAVSANSKQQEAAIEFAKFLMSEEVQGSLAKTMYTIPSVQMEMDTSNVIMQAYLDATLGGFLAGEGLGTFSTEGYNSLLTEIGPQIVLGQITPEQAAEALAPFYS
jgi:ABC-type glycerol-3-phosphate transport system substrate-binding protein